MGFAKINNVVVTDLLEQPSQFSPEIWGMVDQVANKVLFPFAILVLAFYIGMEFLSWVEDHNNMKTSTDIFTKFFFCLLKICLGMTLVNKASYITLSAFDMGAYFLNNAVGVLHISDQTGLNIEALTQQLEAKDFSSVALLWVFSLIALGILKIITILIHAVVIARMVEIYLYCSIGAAPYATLFNKTLSNIGQNYIKNILALSFQGLFMYIILAIYGFLVTKIGISNDPGEAICNLLLVSIVTGIMMMKSKSIAKSIFTAQ